MEIYTIGFTQKTARQFFETLRQANVRQLIDVRLNNISQLAGFSKRDDLAYFLEELCQVQYLHEPLLTPTQDLLDAYKKQQGDWAEYERRFLDLMAKRKVEEQLDQHLFDDPTVLLCSEATAEHCHRRLILDYLNQKWGNIKQIDL